VPGDFAADVAAPSDPNPESGDLSDSLAEFHVPPARLSARWIDATRTHPQLRAQRIAATVDPLTDGVKAPPWRSLGVPTMSRRVVAAE